MEFVKKHKKQIVVMSLMFLGVVAGVAFFQSTVNAAWWEFWKPSVDDEKAAADFLGKYGKYLQYSDNPMKSMLHTLGWGAVTLFYHIVTLIEDCLDGANLLSLFSFVDGKNATIHGIYGSVMSVVVWSVLVLSLVLVGYKLMVGKQSDLKNLTVNIFLSIGLLVLMPTLFGVGQYSGEAFSKGLFNDVKALNTDKKSDESLAFGLIKQNTTDWAYVSQKNRWDDVKKGKNVNQLDENDFSAGVYPLSNLITAKSAKELDTKQGKLLQYHLSKNDDNKTKPVKDSSVASWAPKSFQNGYFQYTLTNTIGVLIGLAALAVAVLFNAFVIVRAIVELAMKRILAPVIFASDIETLQKSKMILSDIMKCYLTIGLTELGMVLFNFWVTYVNGKNMNLLLKVVCFVAGVSFLINGSTSVQRYFGIDIGLQDGKNGWMAALGVGAAIGKGSKAVKSTASNAVGATVAGVAGGAAGIMNGLQKGAGMKLSQAVAGGSTAGSPKESLADQSAETQQRQDSKQKPENSNNIQARKPSLARRAARATGQKIQSAATKQMKKHPGAAKLGSAAGAVAGGSAGLAVRAGKKLSGMNQRTGSHVAEARSDAFKKSEKVNNPNGGLKPAEQQQPEAQQEQGNPETETLSQRQVEQKPLEQQMEVPQQEASQAETPQEFLSDQQEQEGRRQESAAKLGGVQTDAVKVDKTTNNPLQRTESLSQKQIGTSTKARQLQAQGAASVSQPKEVTQVQEAAEQRTEAPQKVQQTAEVRQQASQPKEVTQVQEAAEQRTEAPQKVQQTAEVRQQASQPKEVTQVQEAAEQRTEAPQKVQQTAEVRQQASQPKEVTQVQEAAEQRTEAPQKVQQTAEVRQQASQPKEVTQVQEAAEQRTEAPQKVQQTAEVRQQASQPKEVTQVQEAAEQRTEAPQKVQQTAEVRQQASQPKEVTQVQEAAEQRTEAPQKVQQTAEVRQQASQPKEVTQVQEAAEQRTEAPQKVQQTAEVRQQASQPKEVTQVQEAAEQRTEAPQKVQQTAEVRQQASQPKEVTQVQEAAEQRTEAPQKVQQTTEVRQQASQPKEVTQVQEAAEQRTEAPQKVQQTAEVRQQGTVTPAGTHDYSQIINGGSGNPVTTGSQTQSVQQPQARETVQKPETTTTVQKQKHQGTPKPVDLNNPWGGIDPDRH